MKNHRGNIRITSKTEFRIFSFLLFISAFIYFFRYAGHVLFFQEQQSLLVYLPEYLRKFTEKPGGILEFAGRFLTQFYLNGFAGAFIIALVLTLTGITIYTINRRLKPDALFSTLTALIPPCALLLMQSHYHYQMVYSLGYLFILLCFLFIVKTGKSRARYAYPALFPLIYYIAGGYALIFTCLYIVYSLVNENGAKKTAFPLYIITTAFLTIIISYNFLFIQPLKQLLTFPLPAVNDQVNRFLFLLLTGFIILYPLLLLMKAKPAAGTNKFFNLTGTIASSLLLAATLYTLINKYNPQVARVINLEKYAAGEEWNRVIGAHENYPSKNKIGQYFYNVALSETGQLCDRMFSGRQDFGVDALFMPWDDEHLNWGAYAFYSIGLINEAHRWAYEEMVVNGFRPQNLKMLVKTNLINGNYNMVYKYTGILKRTMFYRKWAAEYERLAGDTAEIRMHPSLANKKEIMPHDNFFIFLETPHDNLPLLVESNPKNQKAFEYLTAWLLLNKDVETVVRNIPKMKELGYTRLPVHIEEAVMIYLNTKGTLPDPAGFTISYATMERFNRYVSAYTSLRQRNATDSRRLEPEFGNTYWFYYHFTKKRNF